MVNGAALYRRLTLCGKTVRSIPSVSSSAFSNSITIALIRSKNRRSIILYLCQHHDGLVDSNLRLPLFVIPLGFIA